MAELSDRRRGFEIANVTTAAAVNTATTAFELPIIPNCVQFIIDVTAAATDVGDTLNITIETQIGAKWHPVYQATEFLGNGGAKIESSDKILPLANGGHDASFAGTLAANASLDVIGTAWRVAYVVVDADSNSAFTFTVTAVVM